MINGLTFLLIAVSTICFYFAGYHAGQEKERERGLNDLKAEKDREIEYELTRHTVLS